MFIGILTKASPRRHISSALFTKIWWPLYNTLKIRGERGKFRDLEQWFWSLQAHSKSNRRNLAAISTFKLVFFVSFKLIINLKLTYLFFNAFVDDKVASILNVFMNFVYSITI